MRSQLFSLISYFIFLFNLNAAEDFLEIPDRCAPKRPATFALQENEPQAKRNCPLPDDQENTSLHIMDLHHDIYYHIFSKITYDEYLRAQFVNRSFYRLINDTQILSLFITDSERTTDFWKNYHKGIIALQDLFSEHLHASVPLKLITNNNLVSLFMLINGHYGVNFDHRKYTFLCASDRYESIIPYLPRIIPLIEITPVYDCMAFDELNNFTEFEIEKVTRNLVDLGIPFHQHILSHLRYVEEGIIPQYKHLIKVLIPAGYQRYLPSSLILEIFKTDYLSFRHIFNNGLEKLYTPQMNAAERLEILNSALTVDPATLQAAIKSIYANRSALFVPNNKRAKIIAAIITLDPEKILAIASFMRNASIWQKGASTHTNIIYALARMTPDRINSITHYFPAIYGGHAEYIQTSMIRDTTLTVILRAQSLAASQLSWLFTRLSVLPLAQMGLFLNTHPFRPEMTMTQRIDLVEQAIESHARSSGSSGSGGTI